MKKNNHFFWPPKKQKTFKNFLNTGISIYKEMFGSLSDENNSLFSRISVANIGYSLDPVKGCPLRCSYCVRLSNKVDGLFDEKKSIKEQRVFNVIPKKIFDGEKLIQALVKHPSFIKNQSIIAIGTGSTEAFAPISEEETFNILKELRFKFKLSNPVWIVTKLGISFNKIEYWKKYFKEFTSIGKIILSITSSGLPSYIENYQSDRFLFVEKLGDCGVYYSHHLRPIIKNINDSYENLFSLLKRSLPLVKSVCLGGIRVDPGISIAWKHISGLKLNLLPNKPNQKDLPTKAVINVREIMDKLNYKHIPLFLHSSHVLSHACGLEDFSLKEFVKLDQDKGKLVLRIEKKYFLKEKNEFLLNKLIKKVLKLMKLNIKYKINETSKVKEIFFYDNLLKDYRINRLLINNLGHFNNKYKIIKTDFYNYWKLYVQNIK